MHRNKIFESIDNRIDQLCQESPSTKQVLMATIPEDLWKTDIHERELTIGLYGDIQGKIFDAHWDVDFKKENECKLFGRKFLIKSKSDLKTLSDIVADVSKDDAILILGGKELKVEESSLLRDYLAARIKQFVACLPYIKSLLFTKFQKVIIYLSKLILKCVMLLKPLPKYMHFNDIQDGSSKLLYITNEFQNWGETGRYA